MATGFIVGAIVGATGVGGGALMTPMLISIFGYSPAVAIATDLLFAAFIKGLISLRSAKLREVDWPIVTKIWLGALPAAMLSVLALRGLVSAEVLDLLPVLVAVMIGFSGYSMLRSMPVGLKRAPHASSLGAILGTLVSLTSVGAGALGMVFLRALMKPNVTMSSMVATDLAVAVPIALVAGAAHFAGGFFDSQLFLLIAPTGLVGAFLGARVRNKVEGQMLRSFVGGILVFAALGMIMKALP